MNMYSKPFMLATLIFLIGIFGGMVLDSIRADIVENNLSESEIMWEDARLLNMYINVIGQEQCDAAFRENLEYNDKIYGYGKDIEDKLEANVFSSELTQEWRKYNLLQFQFWLNSIELKDKCGFDYSNVVYISRMDITPNGETVDNELQSQILLNLKDKCGQNMMLIPLTADADLETIDVVVGQYNITEFPSVIIDEEHVFQGLTSTEELEEHLLCE